MMEKVCVVGLGKAGLPLAAFMSDAEINVIGYDINKKRVQDINRGINPISEEYGLDELIKKNVGKTLKATCEVNEIKNCNVFIIIVPLFIDETNSPDFSIIKTACTTVTSVLKKGDIVVLETTVPVGTTKTLVKDILEKSGLEAGKDFYLVYSPERIMTGYSISRLRELPKIVGGINKESTEKAALFYSKFCDVEKVSNTDTAELLKIASGIYRDSTIAIANEMYKICDIYGVNFWEMQKAIKLKNKFCDLPDAGLGVGGHCIPVYPHFILNDNKIAEIDKKLTIIAREVNDNMIYFFVNKIKGKLGSLKGKKIAVLGLTFREGVKETAYTRSKPFIELLKNEGVIVFGYDPLLSEEEIKKEFDVEKFSNQKVDCIIIVNKDKKLIDIVRSVQDKALIIDCKNILN